MTHYYYDQERNELNGPIDKAPQHSDYQWCACLDCVVLRGLIHHAPSIPHTFTGESRVVPEGEIEWRYEVAWRNPDGTITGWKECEDMFHYEQQPYQYRRRVATPITEEGKPPNEEGDQKQYITDYTTHPSIPAHIVDDMKLDSYYDGFKDGAKITGEPDKPGEKKEGKVVAPFTTEQVNALNKWQKLGYVHEFTCKCSTPLIADKSGWFCQSCITYVQNWAHNYMADEAKHPVDPLKEFRPPSPTPEQGEKGLTMVELPKPTGDFILAQKDIPYKQASDGAYWHYKDVINLLHRYATQQPHSPAQPVTTDEDEADSFASLWHTAEQQKAARKGFLAGRQHERSQQQEELVALRETTRLQHEAMTTAESRGVEKGSHGKPCIELTFPENKPTHPGNYHVFVIDGNSVRPTTAQWTLGMWEILNFKDENCEVVSFIQAYPKAQQPVDAVALQKEIENGIRSRCRGLDDAYWMSEEDVSELAKDIIKELPTLYALFSGSQASNQGGEQ